MYFELYLFCFERLSLAFCVKTSVSYRVSKEQGKFNDNEEDTWIVQIKM